MEYILKQSEPPYIEFPINSKSFIAFVKSKLLTKCLYSPEIQRELNMEWSDNLKQKIESTFEKKGYYDFGRLEIAYLDDKLYILNGQHRFNILCNDCNYDNLTIEVKINKCETEAEMNELFMNVNDSRPCKIVESTSIQVALNKIRKHLQSNYPAYIKSSRRPQKPNINLDVMCECLENIEILQKLTAEEVIDKIEKKNNYYKNSSFQQRQSWNIDESKFQKCRNKSPSKEFVLGLFFADCNWINKLEQENSDNIRVSIRQKIPIQLKREVWEKRNPGKLDGECYVCNSKTSYQSFECGHIQSLYYGGETTINNLEPICRTCNNDMGTTNLEEYKQILIKKNLK